MAPLKNISNFWRTLEMPLNNCEINLILTWSSNCFLLNAPVNNRVPTLHQLEIMQNYCNNWNQVLKEQLTGININKKQQCRNKTDI